MTSGTCRYESTSRTDKEHTHLMKVLLEEVRDGREENRKLRDELRALRKDFDDQTKALSRALETIVQAIPGRAGWTSGMT